MPTYSMAQIAHVAGQAGFSGQARIMASAIAMAESSGRTSVVNSIGCVGLWQIYQRVHQPRYPHWTRSWLQNPLNNARAAWTLSNGGTNWRPWEVFLNGMYQRYMAAARAVVIGSSPVGTALLPPSSGNLWVNPMLGRITSRFGPRWGSFHSGTDIAPTAGDVLVKAAHAGVVVRTRTGSYKGDRRTGALAGRTGNGVVVNHQNGYWSYYGHMASVRVRVGQRVQAGQVLGRVGNTGNVVGVDGTHLHFEVMPANQPNSPINPEPFMRARGATLGSGRSIAVVGHDTGAATGLSPSQEMNATAWAFTFRWRAPPLKNTRPVTRRGYAP